jgi:hypothetical protein
VYATVTIVDKQVQHQKKQVFYVRMNNGTGSIDDETEIQRFIAGRWARRIPSVRADQSSVQSALRRMR